MEGYHPAESFGERAAAVYDEQPRGDETEAVALLVELAAGGPVLELGIGTGRIAVPLAAGGLRVDGIDVSLPMLSRLRAKPGGRHLHVAVGDMAELPVAGAYRLVYVVFNTLFNLLSQDEQVRCFARVGEHLEPDGRLVVEAFVPGFLHRLRDQQHVDAETIAPDQVRLDLARHDPVAQTPDREPRRALRRGHRAVPGRHPLRLAGRARPHGPPGRTRAAPALGRLAPRTLHR